jgi:hypothetical protein
MMENNLPLEALRVQRVAERTDDLQLAGMSPRDAAHFGSRAGADVVDGATMAQAQGEAKVRKRRQADLDVLRLARGGLHRAINRSSIPKWVIDTFERIAWLGQIPAPSAEKDRTAAPQSVTIRPLQWTATPAGHMGAKGVGGFYWPSPQKVGRTRLLFAPHEGGSDMLGEIDDDADMRSLAQQHHDRRVLAWIEG